MATVVETTQCYPKPLLWGSVTFPAPPPAHKRCPGGHALPGRMGGWVCPCACHTGDMPMHVIDGSPDYETLKGLIDVLWDSLGSGVCLKPGDYEALREFHNKTAQAAEDVCIVAHRVFAQFDGNA